jgi:hypothetical protein
MQFCMASTPPIQAKVKSTTSFIKEFFNFCSIRAIRNELIGFEPSILLSVPTYTSDFAQINVVILD